MARTQDNHPSREGVTLVKGRHRWRFSCAAGDLPLMRAALESLAARPDLPFDRFDAALVARQLDAPCAPGLARSGTGPRRNAE